MKSCEIGKRLSLLSGKLENRVSFIFFFGGKIGHSGRRRKVSGVRYGKPLDSTDWL